ncbi:MAG: deoxyribonuclease [Thermoleophilaceae bacterium]|jgi:deoxyribonuclease-4|nr:deoxyribonuclease [Thermoleophilaceae bacterium]
MLIGGHVSPAGGLVSAFQRGVERDCDAIQIFNQSPRAWRPTNYRDEDVAEFRQLLAKGPVRSIVIHAVYLINPASKDPTVREKSLNSLAHALRAGDAIGADGVVVHPGSQVGEPFEPSLRRVGDAIRHVLAESQRCPLLLENTAGAGGTLGRSFEELARLIELGGGHERIGICLDSCHMLASGFDVRKAEGLSEAIDRCTEIVGLERLRCLHVNDSKAPLGSNRDRHAPLGDGELGREGCAAFFSEPRFEGLPAIFEGPGLDGRGAGVADIRIARELRAEGIAARGRARRPSRAGRAGRSRRPAAKPARRRTAG